MEILKPGQGLNILRAVELLADIAVKRRDNRHVTHDVDWIPNDRREKVRAWEEAPILDEIAVASGYRATLLNLGLVGVSYEGLKGYVTERGKDMAETLGVKLEDLEHISRAILDEFRQRGALSRQMLMYHPNHMACPETLLAAEWERRVKQPQGFACDDAGHPLSRMNPGILPSGIIAYNPWHKQGAGGKSPSLERILQHLLSSPRRSPSRSSIINGGSR